MALIFDDEPRFPHVVWLGDACDPQEALAWAAHPDQAGGFQYWFALRPVLIEGRDEMHYRFGFSNPDTAFAFKMRWG